VDESPPNLGSLMKAKAPSRFREAINYSARHSTCAMPNQKSQGWPVQEVVHLVESSKS